MIRFTESHEWLQVKENVGTVGITDYAQKELGEIVYIELPKVGQKVKAGQETAVLESTKAAADVYAPVSGKIIAVNEDLRTDPSAINKAAETSGWIYRIEVTHPKELDHLMTREQYQAIAP
jgi:glycine cleavage system H protein